METRRHTQWHRGEDQHLPRPSVRSPSGPLSNQMGWLSTCKPIVSFWTILNYSRDWFAAPNCSLLPLAVTSSNAAWKALNACCWEMPACTIFVLVGSSFPPLSPESHAPRFETPQVLPPDCCRSSRSTRLQPPDRTASASEVPNARKLFWAPFCAHEVSKLKADAGKINLQALATP